MGLSEEALEELEALEAIFADGFERCGERSLKLRIAPEPDSEGHECAAVNLDIELPEEYPAGAEPRFIAVAGVDDSAEEFKHESCEALLKVAQIAAAEMVGTVSLYSVSEAVRDWLRDNARLEPRQQQVEVTEEDSEGSFDVDSSDLDDEMIEALEDLFENDKVRCKELKRIKRLGPGAAQKNALRAMLKTLTVAERDLLVGSDADSDDSDDSTDAPKSKVPPTKQKQQEPTVTLAPARIECPSGHELTPYSKVPPDYRKFDGDEYTCDICKADREYVYGVYHCCKCFQKGGKQFDACPACGSRAGSGGGQKGQKSKNKKR